MDPILIDTREAYNYARMRGYEPLVDRRFVLEHGLRVSVQRDIFGTGNHEENNLIFYSLGLGSEAAYLRRMFEAVGTVFGNVRFSYWKPWRISAIRV